jgi:hypothetical protein
MTAGYWFSHEGKMTSSPNNQNNPLAAIPVYNAGFAPSGPPYPTDPTNPAGAIPVWIVPNAPTAPYSTNQNDPNGAIPVFVDQYCWAWGDPLIELENGTGAWALEANPGTSGTSIPVYVVSQPTGPTYPNQQNNPQGAIPVWVISGSL